MNTVQRKKIGESMRRAHARKFYLINTYREALKKIHRMPTSGTRARNVAAKALNGHLNGKG